MSGIPSILSAVSLVMATIYIIAALASNGWYKVVAELPTGGSTIAEFGLFKSCAEIAGTKECKSYDFEQMAVSMPDCTRSGDDISSKLTTVKATVIVGLLFSAVGAGAAIGAHATSKSVLRFICIGTGAVAGIMTAVGVAMFGQLFDSWLYCGKSYCDVMTAAGSTSCENKHGYSFIVAAIGLVLAFVGAILRIIDHCMNKDNETNEPYADRSGAYATNPAKKLTPTSNDDEVSKGEYHGGAYEVPEGDWVWDDESSMYWSDQQYLYWDCNSNHYYDPNSSQWYNPDTEEWYEA